MEFCNDTPFGAALYRTQLLGEADAPPSSWRPGQPLPEVAFEAPPRGATMQSVAVLCCRYPILMGRRLGDASDIAQRPTPEPDGPDDPAYGTLLEPGSLPRAGTDVIILGDAIAPGGATHATVRVRLDPYDLELDVIGDRVWIRRALALVASAPAPFERMPVTWGRAYGGAATGPYGPLPFAANPEGRGYYLSAKEAEGRPLPNVEDPHRRVQVWTDQPDPVGFGPYPSSWYLRLRSAVAVDEALASARLRPTLGLFDRAHPRLSGRRVCGEVLVIEGMSHDGRLVLDLPRCPAVVDIQIGARGGTREFSLDEVVVDLRRSLVDLTWRKGFTYVFQPYDRRVAKIRARAGG